MQLSAFLLGALCLVGNAAGFVRHGPVRRDNVADESLAAPKNDTAAPKRFILEFAPGTDASVAVDALTSRLSGSSRILRVFNSDIFRGAAVEADDGNIDSLRGLLSDLVADAWQSRKISLAPSEPTRKFSGAKVDKRDGAAALDTPPAYDIHYMTGVDKLHEAGILGKGVVVAVVDTGVDYNHPALGGGFGDGFKVAGGADLVGDGQWPIDPKAPDSDPIDTQGHGTHVSGIIAGKSSIFTGVAPEATLLNYKVFSEQPSTDEDTLIDAFLMAYDAGADIITSSIGGVNGWVSGAWALVASRLVDQGVVVTISAGNDGQAGPFAASSGSSGDHVLAIASVQASTFATPSFDATFVTPNGSVSTARIAYRSVDPFYPTIVRNWPVYPVGLDTTIEDEACAALPNNTIDLAGKVVLVRRGGCNFSVKQKNLEDKGAQHIVFYTNESPVVIPQADPWQIEIRSNISMISAEAGASIIATIKAGGNVTADFGISPGESYVGSRYEYGGLASTFTSIGATNELFIKPDVAAPGGEILSTYLDGGYAILSGTSMACPYVAGVAALYISAHGGRKTHGTGFARDLAMRIIAAGEPIRWDDGTESGRDFGGWAPVAQVGTGLLNATKLLGSTTSLSFTRFALNDTLHFNAEQSVEVTNNGDAAVSYTFSQLPFGGFEALNRDPAAWATPRIAWFEEMFVVPLEMVPAVSMPESFTLQPGESRTAQFTFSTPQGLDASKLPVYSGKIVVSGSNGDDLAIPYLGLAADLHRDIENMFDYPMGYPTITSTTAKIPMAEKANFTFDLSVAAQDFPEVYIRLRYATTELRWDIFESSWNESDWAYYPPVVGQAGFVGSATTWAEAALGRVFDPEVNSVNDTNALPLRNLPRDISGLAGTTLWWFGKLANGTTIAPGTYRMRLAALVPFGAPDKSADWDVYRTPKFEVLPPPLP